MCLRTDGHMLYFNPRSRKGSDLTSRRISSGLIAISIHAPARGATKAISDLWGLNVISIHAPARGATVIKLVDIFYF